MARRQAAAKRVEADPAASSRERGCAFWFLQATGWLVLAWLIYAQGIPAFDYEWGVKMGTQEPAERVTEVGAAFWYGFAVGDLIAYIPLLGVGLLGHLRGSGWATVPLAAALGVSLYWPIVSLAALVRARGAAGWTVADEMPYWVVCLLTACWALWGLMYLAGVQRSARS